MIYILAKQLSPKQLRKAQSMGTSPCTYVYLKANVLYHASKYFVTSLNVGKEVGVLGKFPPTNPPTLALQ